MYHVSAQGDVHYDVLKCTLLLVLLLYVEYVGTLPDLPGMRVIS